MPPLARAMIWVWATVCMALVSTAINLLCTWWCWRQISAYYRAHELLMELCFHAWKLRRHHRLWPIYERTIGQTWRDEDKGEP